MKRLAYPKGLSHAEVARDIEDLLSRLGGDVLERGATYITARIPISLRFWEGEGVVKITMVPPKEIQIETVEEDLHLTSKGKLFAWSGAIATVPWIFWPFIPALLPLAGLSGILLFMVWLGIGRKPQEKPLLYLSYSLKRRWGKG